MARPTRVALALGSGGARGYAHIGVIGELEARGYETVAVAGSSMGALVGGLYCAGKLDEFSDWVTGLTQRDVVRLMDVSLSKSGGLIGAERVLARVRDILGDTRIEDLPVPFTAVATDLTVGRAVWFQRGSLVDAIRASISIPGVIRPHEYQGQLLGDGGILDPLPVAPTSAVPSDVTIGVVLASDGGPGDGATRAPKAKGLLRRNVAPLLDADFVRSMRDRFGLLPAETDTAAIQSATETTAEHPTGEPAPATHPEDAIRMGRIEVLTRSLDIMSEALTRYQIAGYPPDVLIRIPRSQARTLDFHKATEMIELGRARTVRVLDNLPETP
ncbi:patatin-like phospholipase family protein [Gordonia sp. ABSL1-1]|uniref:patatin-like phospholipase family protein n=1 Tax=Gordonia sp. ABSL1-1 TaxID=3053923 RepID=UPI00257472E1|nr:patatin-like phospholipase family protein [Gordonia sp. ABSL1-1]MDL9938250.1 patatin-like phospholipase family protein [Gordonia sp. ABSL1-1]